MIKNACFSNIKNVKLIKRKFLSNALVAYLIDHHPTARDHLGDFQGSDPHMTLEGALIAVEKDINNFFDLPVKRQGNVSVLEFALDMHGAMTHSTRVRFDLFFCERLKYAGHLIRYFPEPTGQMIKNACFHDIENLNYVDVEFLSEALATYLITQYPRAPDYLPLLLWGEMVLTFPPLAEALEACPICLCEYHLETHPEFDPDQGRLAKTRCNHLFHEMCLGAWSDGREPCPLCRTNLDKFGIDPRLWRQTRAN
jgi:hypothetical protein